MAPSLSRPHTERASRAAVLAYVMALAAASYASDGVESLVAGSVTGHAIGMSLLGAALLGAAGLLYLNPDRLDNGTDPAPWYLWALAAVATLAFSVVALNVIQAVA